MIDESSSGDTDESSSIDADEPGSSDAADAALQNAVDELLDRTDSALEEYDKGYADADATLRVIQTHLNDLRDAAGE